MHGLQDEKRGRVPESHATNGSIRFGAAGPDGLTSARPRLRGNLPGWQILGAPSPAGPTKLIAVILIGCATSKYHANKSNALGTDIIVSPDRVVTECDFIEGYTGDYKNPHGFMIHILDNKKRVITISNGTVLDKKNCFERLEAANRIIQKGKLITIRGRGDADGPTVTSEFSTYFSKHGSFR